ncbi:MAG: hypothetical protein ACYDCK_05935 [Thermoplasmatota archaeon]
MARPIRARTSFLIVLAFVALAFAPVAAADHVYSHRYIVYGRILDANGFPLVNERVGIQYQTFNADLGPCNYEVQAGTLRGLEVSQQSNDIVAVRTDALGDFFYCAHIDAPVPVGSQIIIHVRDVTQSYTTDVNYRHTFVQLTIPNATGTPSAAFNDSVAASGTVWYPSEERLENIDVHGIMVDSASVHLTLVANGQTLEKDVVTTRYGNWSAIFALASPVTSGQLTVTQGATTKTIAIDPKYHTALADLTVPPPPNYTLYYVLGTVGVLVVVGGVGVVGYRFVQGQSEKREMERVRETTTRRRANK